MMVNSSDRLGQSDPEGFLFGQLWGKRMLDLVVPEHKPGTEMARMRGHQKVRQNCSGFSSSDSPCVAFSSKISLCPSKPMGARRVPYGLQVGFFFDKVFLSQRR
jgi:hypothetical protein